jgi:uncharacterized protein YndB with AHSA1/START domain
MDFQPGGVWKFTMHGPDGTNFPNLVRYVLTGPDRIEWVHGGEGEAVEFRGVVTFEEIDPGHTKIEWRMAFPSAEERRRVVDTYDAEKGLAGTLTRLDTLIADRLASEDPFRLHLSVPSDTEIRMVRSFRAPRSLVYEALTDAKHLQNWQSPYKYKTTECSFDARVGGKWTMSQTGADGTTFDFRGEVIELVPNKRIVATFEFLGAPGSVNKNVSELEEIDGLTRLTITSVFETREERDAMLHGGGMEWGAGQAYERLETLVMFAEAEPQIPRFRISRCFAAPKSVVWKAWTEADRFDKWWGPKGCKVNVVSFDPVSAGRIVYSMESEGRGTIWGRFVFREVHPQDRIEWVNSFSDENGGLTRAPFSDKWPLEILNVVTLTESDGKTNLHLEGAPLSASKEELEQFTSWFDSMSHGFGGTFDQLEELLASGRPKKRTTGE